MMRSSVDSLSQTLKMTTEKYERAVDLISDKHGLPDLAYQAKIVSDLDKEKAREIILGIKDRMQQICDRVKPGKNNVLVPFHQTVANSLPKQNASDMTTATRLFGILNLLPIINIDKRPKITVREKGNPVIQTIPFTLFEDLREVIFLMEYATGVRPYILEWYYDVFLDAYNSKAEPDSREKDDKIIVEKRIALTTEQLVEKTREVNNQSHTTKKLLETYIYPLINQGFIDKTESELDKRSNVYYPVVAITRTTRKYIKLFENDKSNNYLQQIKVPVSDSKLFPDKRYLISKIQGVLRYYSENYDLEIKIKDHKGQTIIIEELVDQYYKNPEEYFNTKYINDEKNKQAAAAKDFSSSATVANISNTSSIQNNIIYEKSIICSKVTTYSPVRQDLSSFFLQSTPSQEQNNLAKSGLLEEYRETNEIDSELQENSYQNVEKLSPEDNASNKLFDSVENE